MEKSTRRLNTATELPKVREEIVAREALFLMLLAETAQFPRQVLLLALHLATTFFVDVSNREVASCWALSGLCLQISSLNPNELPTSTNTNS